MWTLSVSECEIVRTRDSFRTLFSITNDHILHWKFCPDLTPKFSALCPSAIHFRCYHPQILFIPIDCDDDDSSFCCCSFSPTTIQAAAAVSLWSQWTDGNRNNRVIIISWTGLISADPVSPSVLWICYVVVPHNRCERKHSKNYSCTTWNPLSSIAPLLLRGHFRDNKRRALAMKQW